MDTPAVCVAGHCPSAKRDEEHGQNILNLVVVVGYLRSLLGNRTVVRILLQAEPAILGEYQKTTHLAAIKQGHRLKT